MRKVACAILGLAMALPAAAAEKRPVQSLDDLPRHTYPVKSTASALLTDDGEFQALAEAVRADILTDLETYDITDPTTLQGLHGTLVRLDLLDGDWKGALERMETIRSLEDKEAARYVGNLTRRVHAQVHTVLGSEADDADIAAGYRDALTKAVAAMPWEVVQEDLEQIKGNAEIISANVIQGLIAAQIDPAVAASGELSSELAATVIRMREALKYSVPLAQVTVSVLGEAIAAHRVEKDDIWEARSVTIDPETKASPVVVAIWDSGVDTAIFTDQLWSNRKEKADGADTDDNGFVDDLHGIAFDWQGRAVSNLLYSEPAMDSKIGSIMDHTKGFMDIQASVDSPEAAALKKHLSTIDPAAMRGFLEGLSYSSLYMHGTHVAGIATDGNPFAKVLVARISFDYHLPPVAITVEDAKRHAASYAATVKYFQAAGVRVANMSWGWGLREIEGILEGAGVGETAEERTELARTIFGILKQGLHDAMASAPEILFVTAAGNSDNDVDFDEEIPSNFRLPNMLVVAAVDQAGEPTNFTSGGDNVRLAANGYEVDSFIPGGERMKASGTSMSSPNVVNLAAKLLAVKPDLTTEGLIAAIVDNADPSDAGYLLINPKASLAAVAAGS